MPKIILTEKQRRANAIASLIASAMLEYDLSQSDVAKILHTSKATLCRRIKDGEFTTSQLATMAKSFQWSDTDLVKIFRKEVRRYDRD